MITNLSVFLVSTRASQTMVSLGSAMSQTHLEWGRARNFRAPDLVKCRIKWTEALFKKTERIRNLKWWMRWMTSLTSRTNRPTCSESTEWPLWTAKCPKTHLIPKQVGLKTICKWASLASVWWVTWVSLPQWSNLQGPIKRKPVLIIKRKLNAGFEYIIIINLGKLIR